MQLSTKSRYAIRAMIELTLNYGKGTIQLKEIARRQDISEKYLEQVMLPMRTNGFVYTQKGSKGGYSLAVDPKNITLFDIVNTMEGSLSLVPCVDNKETCNRTEICVTRDVWVRLNTVLCEELKLIILMDLALKQKKKQEENKDTPNYQI